ncbi:cyclic nucleotide-binding domain-containing protein [Uliginosibacterium sp. 31-16]|uniref:Crp/Fnr family transcriptional regulator n=1 Tax=Uliginosibacterium sp. 31-16 TaxID=3068315 RepID=UPI00273EB2D1|nr:cyclic nucleotide-binding domain-containing protein [Uliginosibacterium sp. 31-16]MDP5238202.1 cyclic nucleotide-binding domain-containing protein [Uliginosibacterium sp. 31-16]
MQETSGSAERQLAAGNLLYQAGQGGNAWLLLEGSIRLDRPEVRDESGFAGIAIKGDILGAETMLLGNYTYTATALTPCKLTRWPEGSSQPEPAALLKALSSAERRGADAVAMRCGEAATRVRRLIALMAATSSSRQLSRLMLPALRDMAEITALTIGTVSRILVQLQAAGDLARSETRRGRPRNTALAKPNFL